MWLMEMAKIIRANFDGLKDKKLMLICSKFVNATISRRWVDCTLGVFSRALSTIEVRYHHSIAFTVVTLDLVT